MVNFHSFEGTDDLGFGDRESAGNLCGTPACLLLAYLLGVAVAVFWLQDCVLRVVMDHAFKDYVAGLAAGLATVVIGHPFDTVKVGNKTVCVCFVFFLLCCSFSSSGNAFFCSCSQFLSPPISHSSSVVI